MKRYVEWVGAGVSGIEFVIYAVLAGLLVVVGLPLWLYRLLANHHAAMASVVGGCWLGSVFAVAREVRNKAVTALSPGLFLGWVVVLVYVFHNSLFRDGLA